MLQSSTSNHCNHFYTGVRTAVLLREHVPLARLNRKAPVRSRIRDVFQTCQRGSQSTSLLVANFEESEELPRELCFSVKRHVNRSRYACMHRRVYLPGPPNSGSRVRRNGASHGRRALRHGAEFQAPDRIDNARKTDTHTCHRKRRGAHERLGHQTAAETDNSKHQTRTRT